MNTRQRPRTQAAVREQTVWDCVTVAIFASLALIAWWSLAVK
jgi:hypothetical protein